MFGADLMSKLAEMQKIASANKQKLNDELVLGDSGGGLIVVEMTGNRELRSVQINAELKSMEKEHLEDLLCVALNRALEKVNALHEMDAVQTAQQFFPNM